MRRARCVLSRGCRPSTSVAGGGRSTTRQPADAARRRRGRGLRRLGLFQARAPAAGRAWSWNGCSTAPPTRTPRSTPRTLRAALGPHAPTTLDPTSPALPLPAAPTVTVEPGGQVEIASPPLPDLAALLQTAQADAAVLHRTARRGRPAHGPARPSRVRPPGRILDTPRYRAMERVFDRVGPVRPQRMCATAAVQVCLDAGDGRRGHRPPLGRGARRGPGAGGRVRQLAAAARAAHRLGPRAGLLVRADPARTAPAAPTTPTAADPGGLGAAGAGQPAAVRARGRRPGSVPERMTFARLDRRARCPRPPTVGRPRLPPATLFPPVRPRGHLEVRYVDAQAGRRLGGAGRRAGALLSRSGDHRHGPGGLRARRGPLGRRGPARPGRPGAGPGGRHPVRAWPAPGSTRSVRPAGSSRT